jgi:hypothetical protein
MYTKIYKEVPQLALPKADEAQYSYLSSFELSVCFTFHCQIVDFEFINETSGSLK